MTARATNGCAASAGFSLVEVLVVILITMVGFLALLGMQVGTLHAVGNTRSMTEAVNLAEHFIGTLKAESVSWTSDASSSLLDSGQSSTFRYLGSAGAATDGGGSGWLEAYDHMVGPLGEDDGGWDVGVATEVRPALNRSFCLHYRLTWLVPNYLIRADVRVLWLKPEADITIYQDCSFASNMHLDLANVGSITVPAAIMRNVFANSETLE